MKIKEVSQLTDLPESTIRFYEEEGLVVPEKEYINGRYYRNYSDYDVHLLKTIGTLRKARFSMDEIRFMISDPEAIEHICTTCRQRLVEESAALQEISSALARLKKDSIENIFSLADALSEKAKNVELPARDIQVSFGRFDDEQWDEPESPEPGEVLVNDTNEKINRIMGAQPAEYVYSTGMFSNASPNKRMAMEEFSAAISSEYESGYPSYMSEARESKPWVKVLWVICGLAIALFCFSLMFSAWGGHGNVTRSGRVNLEYDSEGRTTKYALYDDDGYVVSYTEVEYDDSGNQILVRRLSADEELLSCTVREFNEFKTVTNEKTYDANDTVTQAIINEYDDSGNILSSKVYDGNNKIIHAEVYDYYEDGTPLSIKNYDENGELTYYAENVNHHTGSTIEWVDMLG